MTDDRKRSGARAIVLAAIGLLTLMNVQEQYATATPATVETAQETTWRGIRIAPERRCAPYDAEDYRYSQSVEPRIIAAQGGIYGPYTGRWFSNRGQTDIEHIVARSEAHDSGLCAADAATKRRFASDLRNLTLASPSVNRNQKRDRDAAEWLPQRNRCWYAARIVEVRRAYGLTVDAREANALDRVLAGCTSSRMIMFEGTATTPAGGTSTGRQSGTDGLSPLDRWDDNGNGRITCAEARRHGIAPVLRGHPAYAYMRDGDGDGVVCER